MIKTWQQRCDEHPDHQQGIVTQQMIQDRMQEEIDELRQALAQPVDAVNISAERVDETAKREQEPVAWMYVNDDGECEQIEYGEPFDDPSVTPLYTAPPKREWVGLTDDELQDIAKNFSAFMTFDFARAIEAKLKEKNNG